MGRRRTNSRSPGRMLLDELQRNALDGAENESQAAAARCMLDAMRRISEYQEQHDEPMPDEAIEALSAECSKRIQFITEGVC